MDAVLQRIMLLATYYDRSAEQKAELSRLFAELSEGDWAALWELVNWHGIDSLMQAHLGQSAGELPPEAKRSLAVLVLKQQHTSRVQQKVLAQILAGLTDHHIQATLLKGAALSHLIYDPPSLRPMADLDLLIKPGKLGKAQDVLLNMGFELQEGPGNAGQRSDAIHAQELARTQDGVRVVVELHHMLSNHQVPGHRELEVLDERPLSFKLNPDGPSAHTLAPSKMLWHLCHHFVHHCMFSVRVLWMWDIWAFAQRYHDQVDWPKMAVDAPLVLSTLSLLDQFWPVSPELRSKLGLWTKTRRPNLQPELRRWAMPWSAAKAQQGSLAFMGQLYFPSDWWLRLYHGLGAHKNTWLYRWILHPAHITKRIYQRSKVNT